MQDATSEDVLRFLNDVDPGFEATESLPPIDPAVMLPDEPRHELLLSAFEHSIRALYDAVVGAVTSSTAAGALTCVIALVFIAIFAVAAVDETKTRAKLRNTSASHEIMLGMSRFVLFQLRCLAYLIIGTFAVAAGIITALLVMADTTKTLW